MIVGIDPGGRWTGIVARSESEFVAGELVDQKKCPGDWVDYLDAIWASLRCVWERCDRGDEEMIVALEGVRAPNPHVRMSNVSALLDTAQVIGGLRWRLADRCVMVDPGGHGSQLLASYPAELVGERERRGTGKLRHMRSAWDVAGAAMWWVRR